MALTVHPADGLIHRLLQQNSRTPTTKSGVSAEPGVHRDSINISDEARGQAQHTPEPSPSRLENQLLRMYTHHGHAS